MAARLRPCRASSHCRNGQLPCPKALVAYNINLSTNNLEIATKIAKNIRHINGGLRYVKAMGVELKERNITQVSINMTDYTRTALYRAFELVRIEARRYGVAIVGSEIIGLVPMEALIDTASYYLGLENFSMQQVRKRVSWNSARSIKIMCVRYKAAETYIEL